MIHSKKLTRLLSGTLGLLLLAAPFTACQKDTVDPDPSVPALKSLSDLVASDRNLSFLQTALTRANLTSALAGPGPLTLFAPTNAAFTAAGLDSVTILKADPATLAAVLQYHVLGSAVKSTDLTKGVNREVATLGGTAYVSKFDYGVGINGSRVTLADVQATNGVVHFIDAAITPVRGNLVATVQANPDYSLLTKAVVKAGLVEALSGPGPFTLFAPTNAAFAAAGIDEAYINAAAPADLANVLKYHVINGRVFTTNFAPDPVVKELAGALPPSAAVFPTLLGPESNSILSYQYEGELSLLGNKQRISDNPVNSAVKFSNFITRANVGATNGVIHAIDQVLLPADQNVVQLLQDKPNYSLLVQAVTRANLAGALGTGPGPYTVFAPDNKAFIAFLAIPEKEKFVSNEDGLEKERARTAEAIMADAVAKINATDPAALAAVLNNHVVPSRLFSINLTGGDVTTAAGGKLTVATGDGVTLKSAGFGADEKAAVTKVNLGATNGVVHFVDKVLKP